MMRQVETSPLEKSRAEWGPGCRGLPPQPLWGGDVGAEPEMKQESE